MSTLSIDLAPLPGSDGPLAPETIIAGRYRVLGGIGSGGMGSVYLGEHLSVGRKVAIKVLHGEWSTMPAVAARFAAEARTASAIGHPGIVDVLDAGALADGRLYLVMEYLAGRDLDRELAEDGPLPPIRACRLIRAAAQAIAAAHAAGIVHRDLKPDNILVTERAGEEIIKVLDFGIAADRRHTRFNAATTAPGTMIGTPEHMPPEQAIGDEVGPHFDIYALGSTLFTLLVGTPPFVDDNPLRLLATKQSEPAPRLDELVDDVPAPLVELIADALAIHIPQRPATVDEFIERLDAVIRGLDPGWTASYAAVVGRSSAGEKHERVVTPIGGSSSSRNLANESVARTILASSSGERRGVSPRLVLGGALLLGAIALLGASIGGPSAATEASTRTELAVGPADAMNPSKGPEVPRPHGGVAPTIPAADATPTDAAPEPANTPTDAAPPTTPSDPVAPDTVAPDTVAPDTVAPNAAAPTKTTDDRIAPAPDDQSAPATVIKRTAKVAEHLTPRCEQLREQTRVARDAYRWKTVLELARERRCWARSADARKLETQARMESGDFAGCVAASSGLEDLEVARWRDLCRKRGGLG